ncbi:MAG: MarR family transcriptional regulator, partial [Lachnospiraceae bacterium]
IKKGYLKKRQSEDDKREYHLVPTEKYMDYYNISYTYMDTVLKRVQERFSKEEVDELVRILNTTADELMPEIELKHII